MDGNESTDPQHEADIERAEMAQDIQYTRQRVDEIYETLQGNGDKGIVRRVESLETKMKVIGAMAVMGATGVIGFVVAVFT